LKLEVFIVTEHFLKSEKKNLNDFKILWYTYELKKNNNNLNKRKYGDEHVWYAIYAYNDNVFV